MTLRRDEIKLIQLVREKPNFCIFRVEKRPSKEFPDGEITRVVVEESVLLADIGLKAEIVL